MVTTEAVEPVDLEEGQQAIAMLSAMDDPLDLLPDHAFDDLLVLSTRGHPQEIQDYVEKRGLDPSGVYVLPVSGSTVRYDGPLTVAERTGPTNLTKVGVVFSNTLESMDDNPWVLFDNFNILLMYADESRVYRFMDTMIGNVRARDGCGVYCTVRDAVEDQTYEKFRQLCEVEIDRR